MLPGGTSTPAPSFIRRSRIASASLTSQALSKTENMRSRSRENIFSAPTASATSPSPDLTKFTARYIAVLPLAQAFSTFVTGMPEIPIARSATWPRIMCWPSMCPCEALPKKAAWSSPAPTPASASASSTAWRVIALMLVSISLPKGVMPTPTT